MAIRTVNFRSQRENPSPFTVFFFGLQLYMQLRYENREVGGMVPGPNPTNPPYPPKHTFNSLSHSPVQSFPAHPLLLLLQAPFPPSPPHITTTTGPSRPPFHGCPLVHPPACTTAILYTSLFPPPSTVPPANPPPVLAPGSQSACSTFRAGASK